MRTTDSYNGRSPRPNQAGTIYTSPKQRNRLIALGLIATVGIPVGAATISGSQRNADLVSKLSRPAATVYSEVADGQIAGRDVVQVTAPGPSDESATTLADKVSTPAATGEVRNILSVQAGGNGMVEGDAHYLIPADDYQLPGNPK